MSALTLESLAGQINAEHQAAEQSALSALEHARKAGELLIQAKSRLDHGQWLPWLKENVSVGERQAQKYMRLASHPELVNTKSNSDLSIDDALKFLSSRSTETELPQVKMKSTAEKFTAWMAGQEFTSLEWTKEEAAEIVDILSPWNFYKNDQPVEELGPWDYLEALKCIKTGKPYAFFNEYLWLLKVAGRPVNLPHIVAESHLGAQRMIGRIYADLEARGEWVREGKMGRPRDMVAWAERCIANNEHALMALEIQARRKAEAKP